MKFDLQAVQKIAEVLQTEVKARGNTFRMVLDHAESGQRLSLEIFPDLIMGKGKGTLISVYTNWSHLQLHYCTAFIATPSLGEVIFVAENHGRVSGLVVVKDAGCSFFTNVDGSNLSSDFMKLAPEVMPAAVALSVIEEVLPRKKKRAAKKSAAKKKASAKKPAGRKRAR